MRRRLVRRPSCTRVAVIASLVLLVLPSPAAAEGEPEEFVVAIRGVRDGATVSGTVLLAAEVAGVEVERVNFFIDDRLRGTERQGRTCCTADDGVWQTKVEANRFHHLTVRAVATDGRSPSPRRM